MRINVAVPEAHVSAPVLNSALESVTRLNESLLKSGEVPTFDQGLHHGVRWKPEPPGQEHFDHAGTVLGRRWGDCDDLAPWHAATLRHKGIDPKATAIAQRSGPNRWHAVVQRSDGSIDDPSKRAGMGQPSIGICGAGVLPLMPGSSSSVVGSVGAYLLRPQIAMRPVYGAFQARADIPWRWRDHLMHDKPSPTDIAMTALHTAPVAHTAITGAIDGVLELAQVCGAADEDHMQRLSCLGDAFDGADLHELARIYGDDAAEHATQIVGSFWSSLKSLASPVANLARGAVKFIPGVGPVIDTGLNMAEKAMAAAKGIPGAAAVQPGGMPGGNRGFNCTFF